MIEVDVFWSFAIGSSFAAFAGSLLQKEKYWDVNPYFIYTLVFLSLIFAPSGIYLLWAFPGWESMFYFKTKDEIHAIIPMIFAFTNVFLGILGFFYTYGYVKRGRFLDAHTVWVRAYGIMMGILGFGYRRFLYPGTGPEWDEKDYELLAFFGSPVFFTLIAMGVIVLPALLYPQLQWFWKCGNDFDSQVRVWLHISNVVLGNVLIGAIGYTAFIYLYCDDALREYFKDGPLSFFAPLGGFVVAQVAFYFLITFFLLVPRPPFKVIK